MDRIKKSWENAGQRAQKRSHRKEYYRQICEEADKELGYELETKNEPKSSEVSGTSKLKEMVKKPFERKKNLEKSDKRTEAAKKFLQDYRAFEQVYDILYRPLKHFSRYSNDGLLSDLPIDNLQRRLKKVEESLHKLRQPDSDEDVLQQKDEYIRKFTASKLKALKNAREKMSQAAKKGFNEAQWTLKNMDIIIKGVERCKDSLERKIERCKENIEGKIEKEENNDINVKTVELNLNNLAVSMKREIENRVINEKKYLRELYNDIAILSSENEKNIEEISESEYARKFINPLKILMKATKAILEPPVSREKGKEKETDSINLNKDNKDLFDQYKIIADCRKELSEAFKPWEAYVEARSDMRAKVEEVKKALDGVDTDEDFQEEIKKVRAITNKARNLLNNGEASTKELLEGFQELDQSLKDWDSKEATDQSSQVKDIEKYFRDLFTSLLKEENILESQILQSVDRHMHVKDIKETYGEVIAKIFAVARGDTLKKKSQQTPRCDITEVFNKRYKKPNVKPAENEPDFFEVVIETSALPYSHHIFKPMILADNTPLYSPFPQTISYINLGNPQEGIIIEKRNYRIDDEKVDIPGTYAVPNSEILSKVCELTKIKTINKIIIDRLDNTEGLDTLNLFGFNLADEILISSKNNNKELNMLFRALHGCPSFHTIDMLLEQHKEEYGAKEIKSIELGKGKLGFAIEVNIGNK